MPERHSLDTVAAALAEIMGIPAPKHANTANPELLTFANQRFSGQKADRIVMYNPDAVAQWVCGKYPKFLKEVISRTQLKLPLEAPMPSVTPVCFGTMYTGAQPEVHTLQLDGEKHVIPIDTLFDALIRAGRKPVLLAYAGGSLSVIYNGREMDYYMYKDFSELNAKAVQLILEDQHDFYVIYNGGYDFRLHDHGPEAPETLGELRINSHMFGLIHELIRANWKHHRTLLGFAMDHGCHLNMENWDNDPHEIGTHGLDTPEDRHIMHYYTTIGGEDVQ
ncbi:MAG: hypothetical protein E7437_05950 [Ruminococcaceae bacterium]|nr:hypothetical protein [Oscillospiraceae bacterium]